MALQDPDAPYFIDDGHTVTFGWVRDEIKILSVSCPNDGTASLCNRMRAYCVVRRFLEVHGPEVNLGRCEIDGPVRIAWSPIEGESDIDQEYAQVWVTPVTDHDYLAMLEEQQEGEGPTAP